MEDKIKQELKNCNTLNEMWAVLNKYWDLDTQLGPLGKPLAVTQLSSKIGRITTTLSIKKR